VDEAEFLKRRHLAFAVASKYRAAPDYDDILQEAQFAIWRAPSGIARNLLVVRVNRDVIDYLRRTHGRPGSPKNAAWHQPIDELLQHPPVHDEYDLDALAYLTQDVDRLPARERAIIDAIYWHEVSINTLARWMHVSPGRVRQLHTRAIKRLRESQPEEG
jgi:RNA polymerase sigma factor (sigma-70 family)